MSYESAFTFASKQPNFSCYFNQGKNVLTANQIISFFITEQNIDDIVRLVTSCIANYTDMFFYIDDMELNATNLHLIRENIDEYFEIRVEHSLVQQKYPIFLVDNNSFEELISTSIVLLEIKNLVNIKNKIILSFLNSEDFKLEDSILFTTIRDIPSSRIAWAPAMLDDYFSEKKALSIPNLLPEYVTSDSNLSRKIFINFLDAISEKKISENEFLLQIGDINSIVVEKEFCLSSDEINKVYSISSYIFQDNYNFLEKLWILRRKIGDSLLEGYEIQFIPWEKILKSVKNNYYFLVHDTIDKYIAKREEMERSVIDISQELNKIISSIIDDLKKEILTFLATIIASFALKIDFNQQLLFIGAAWSYSLILLITNFLKGFHFHSKLIEQRISNLKENLGEIYNREKKSIDETIVQRTDMLLNKLKKFETLNKIIIVGLFMILSIIFFIA